MYELDVTKLGDVEQYIIETSSIYFSCILKGKAKGIIWGNQERSPDFLVVWSPYQEGFQLMGKPVKSTEWKQIRGWFMSTIIPILKLQGMDCFEYGTDTKELADMFKAIFADIPILSAPQRIYRWSSWKESITQPIGYEVKKVGRDFLLDSSVDKSFIVEEIERAYGEVNLLDERGIAYVAIYKNKVVARADMLFQSNGEGNISVSTMEAHRQKGVSSYLTMKTIEDTLEMGITPIWDCTDDNVASDKTATKSGFQHIRDDSISWFMLKDINITTKAILFDFDGVLTIDKAGSPQIINYISKVCNLPSELVATSYYKFNDALLNGIITHEQMWSEFCRDVGKNIDYQVLIDAFKDTVLDEQMITYLKSLKSNYRIGMVTDNKTDRIQVVLAHNELEQYFDVVAISAQVHSGKEHKPIFQYVLDNLNIQPCECVFIDNTQSNLVVPKQMRMKTILFDDERRDFKEFKRVLEENLADIE